MAVALSRSWLAHATLQLVSSLRYVPHRKTCRYMFTSWYKAVRITLNSNNYIIVLIKSEGSFISRVTHTTPTTRLLPPIPAPKLSGLRLPPFTTSGVITTDVRVVSFDKCIVKQSINVWHEILAKATQNYIHYKESGKNLWERISKYYTYLT